MVSIEKKSSSKIVLFSLSIRDVTHLPLLHISGSYHLLLSKGRRRYSSHSISRQISQLSSAVLSERRGKISKDNYAVSKCPHQWCRGWGSCYWRGRLWSQLGIWRYKMKVLRCPDVNIIPDQPVQSGLIPPDVVDNEERCQPVLGLEGCSLPEVTGTGPNACEGKICQSININTANIALSTINYL